MPPTDKHGEPLLEILRGIADDEARGVDKDRKRGARHACERCIAAVESWLRCNASRSAERATNAAPQDSGRVGASQSHDPAVAAPASSDLPPIKVFTFGADRYEGDKAIHEMCVRAADYQALLARFTKACGEITRLNGVESATSAQLALDQQSDDPAPGDWNAACRHIADLLRRSEGRDA